MTATEVGQEVAKRLADLYPEDGRDLEIEDFIARFNEVEDEDEFDSLIDELYDWGDAGHRLWIATLF